MKICFFFLCIFSFCIFSSFDDKKACDYAGSNVGYVKTQTQKALEARDINISRFYAYKAVNAIEKSKNQFEDCGCKSAAKSIYKGLDHLKLATRVSSLDGTRILLKRALENTLSSLDELKEHDTLHNSEYANDLLAMNTKKTEEDKLRMKQPQGKLLEEKIDRSLLNFQNSLEEVVVSVECKEAYDFASKIFKHCEQQLLKPDLTEAKKYYNLRTKEITAAALAKLEHCKNKPNDPF
jgi:hypothetical protein